ncbi:uncharacterized protein EMH_0085710 [Eimeria mitis]|uniref:Uncharacterized protein n=1 Tax=Eimeria mitis TaxID=44415 RepID=U6KEF1_9EIME|nr:uncharacterized protein EMH_0085710 [Eimeria mitis]CDJ33828.1 hypothetical protein EMH_0085710 [Eimeria mitis]
MQCGLSAGEGRKRGFESLCESDSDEASAWLDSDSDHDASASTVPPAKQPRSGQELHESSSLPVTQQQSISPQMAPSASALPGTHSLRASPVALSDPTHWGASHSQKEVDAADALLELSTSTSSVEAAGGGAREQGGEEPQPSTSAESTQSARRLRKRLPAAERAAAEVSAAIALGNLPTSSHPFVRLPVVDQSKLLRSFSTTTAVCEGWLTVKPTLLLSRAREHLAKPSLTPEEMEKLTYDAERLCKYIVHATSPDKHAPSRIVAEYLGLQFLCMDVIVATLQLLGEPARGPWWERVTGKIRLDFSSQWQLLAPPNAPAKTHYSNVLCRELNLALRLLMTGKRPSDVDLIKIKRMLFCSQLSPRRFRGSEFDAWRNDGKPFCSPKGPA